MNPRRRWIKCVPLPSGNGNVQLASGPNWNPLGNEIEERSVICPSFRRSFICNYHQILCPLLVPSSFRVHVRLFTSHPRRPRRRRPWDKDRVGLLINPWPAPVLSFHRHFLQTSTFTLLISLRPPRIRLWLAHFSSSSSSSASDSGLVGGPERGRDGILIS